MNRLRFTDEHYRRPLNERWNVAMTRAGFVGSEWIDEPERIAQRLADQRVELLRLRLEVVRLRKENRAVIRLIPYFNSTLLPARPGDRWEQADPPTTRYFSGEWQEGDTLVRSELDFQAVEETPLPDQLSRVFREMNADDRPNGRRERSLSVGDMVAVVQEDLGLALVYRVAPVGFVRQIPIPDTIGNDVLERRAS